MTPDQIFQIANLTALAGWAALLASPLIPKLADRIAGMAIPSLLAVLYCGLILAYFGQSDGGFDTLANVMRLFGKPEAVLAGWIHYLAFDLFIGAWEVRTARSEGVPFLLVVPCLVLTFLFGPAGLLTFFAIRAVRSLMAAGGPSSLSS